MFVSSEQNFVEHSEPLPEGVSIVHFKIVNVGPNTQQQAGRIGSAICELVKTQPGFFVVSDNITETRQAMIDIINRFCDTLEGK